MWSALKIWVFTPDRRETAFEYVTSEFSIGGIPSRHFLLYFRQIPGCLPFIVTIFMRVIDNGVSVLYRWGCFAQTP